MNFKHNIKDTGMTGYSTELNDKKITHVQLVAAYLIRDILKMKRTCAKYNFIYCKKEKSTQHCANKTQIFLPHCKLPH